MCIYIRPEGQSHLGEGENNSLRTCAYVQHRYQKLMSYPCDADVPVAEVAKTAATSMLHSSNATQNYPIRQVAIALPLRNRFIKVLLILLTYYQRQKKCRFFAKSFFEFKIAITSLKMKIEQIFLQIKIRHYMPLQDL